MEGYIICIPISIKLYKMFNFFLLYVLESITLCISLSVRCKNSVQFQMCMPRVCEHFINFTTYIHGYGNDTILHKISL